MTGGVTGRMAGVVAGFHNAFGYRDELVICQVVDGNRELVGILVVGSVVPVIVSAAMGATPGSAAAVFRVRSAFQFV